MGLPNQVESKEFDTAYIKEVETCAPTESNDERLELFTEEEQKNIVRRVDRRLVLTLGFMFATSLIDRANIGYAIIGGMAVDMNLIGMRYSIINLVFFITYVLFQPMATVVLRKVGPRIFLPTITLLWGVTIMSFGFARRWTDLVALRLVLGLFEGGFFPGAVYLLSCWYPRYDLQKRNAVFYLIASLFTSISGILAYGLMQMSGLGGGNSYLGQSYGPTKANPTASSGHMSGIAGWRWIFIIEGVITCVVAIAGYALVVDFPEEAPNSWGFLNEAEASFILAKIERDRQDTVTQPFKLKEYLSAGLDLNIWAFALLFCLTTMQGYAISYFLPIILQQGMGFSTAASMCLIAPPVAAASVFLYIGAYLSDKYRLRAPFIIVNGVISLIGVPLLGFAKQNGVRYFGAFLTAVAAYAQAPSVMTYQANNIRGHWKRAFCSATLVSAGGIGGIMGSTVFRSQDAPDYIPGLITVMIGSGTMMLITCLLSVRFYRANKRADAGLLVIEGLEGFRYTL